MYDFEREEITAEQQCFDSDEWLWRCFDNHGLDYSNNYRLLVNILGELIAPIVGFILGLIFWGDFTIAFNLFANL